MAVGAALLAALLIADRAAVIYAQGRTLANVFSFERRKAAVDMSPLRAASFAYWGLCQYSATAEPGAWWV